MALHLSTLYCSCYFCDHTLSRSRSSCKDLPSSTVFTGPQIFVSSANILVPLLTMSGRSLTNIYSSGPMTDPCGTPLLTSVYDDSIPSTITLIFRLITKILIQIQRVPENPYFFSFISNRSRGTVSNAFQKSRYMKLRLLSFR